MSPPLLATEHLFSSNPRPGGWLATVRLAPSLGGRLLTPMVGLVLSHWIPLPRLLARGATCRKSDTGGDAMGLDRAPPVPWCCSTLDRSRTSLGWADAGLDAAAHQTNDAGAGRRPRPGDGPVSAPALMEGWWRKGSYLRQLGCQTLAAGSVRCAAR